MTYTFTPVNGWLKLSYGEKAMALTPSGVLGLSLSGKVISLIPAASPGNPVEINTLSDTVFLYSEVYPPGSSPTDLYDLLLGQLSLLNNL